MKSTHVARANPRLIPIAAPDVLQEAVKRIAGRLETWARATRHKSGAPGYMLSDEVQLPKAGHPGFTRSVRIDIIGEAWHRDRRFVIGGYYVANVIQLTVQADNLRRWLGGESVNEMSRWTLRKELTEILAHEMTHAAEHSLRPSRGTYSGTPNSYQQWANDPREVSAQARLIWEQIRDDLDWNQELYKVDRAEGKEKGTLVEYLLRRSTEYEKMVKQMAPANIKKVERIIERELREAGINTEGTGAMRNPRGNALRNPVSAISDRFRFYTEAPILGKHRGVAVVVEPKAGEWMVKVGAAGEWFVEIGSMYEGGNLRSRRAVAHVIEQTIARDEWSQDAQTILDYWSGRESSGVFGDWPRPAPIDNTSLIWQWQVAGHSVGGAVNGSLYRWKNELLKWRHAASDKFKARLIKSLPSNPKLNGFVSNVTWKVSGGDLWEWSYRFGTDFIDMAKELRTKPLRGMKEAGVTMSMQSQIADDLEEVGRKICEADALFNAEHEARNERLTALIEKANAGRCVVR